MLVRSWCAGNHAEEISLRVSIRPGLARRLIGVHKGGAMKSLTFIRHSESYRESPRRRLASHKGGAIKSRTFIRHSESYRETPPPAALMEAMGKFIEKSLAE